MDGFPVEHFPPSRVIYGYGVINSRNFQSVHLVKTTKIITKKTTTEKLLYFGILYLK